MTQGQSPAGEDSATAPPKGGRWRRRLAVVGLILLVAGVAGVVWYRIPPKPLFPDYAIDLRLRPDPKASGDATLRAGFAALDITPTVEEGGDPVWLAGFEIGRRATGVHDPLWARALVLDDGTHRVGLCVIDLIGHGYVDTIRVREAISEEAGLDYVALISTHNHEAPDSVGLWGRLPLISGRDPAYLAHVRAQAALALEQAAASLRPARLTIGQAPSGNGERRRVSGDEGREALFRGLIRDDRPPHVIHDTVTAVRFDPVGAETPGAAGSALGTVVIWSNHPEALADQNTLVTSDFPHYIRERMEAEAGGTCLFLAGAIGGLMSPLDVEVLMPDGSLSREPTFERAEAMGRSVADTALRALQGEAAITVDRAPISVRAKTIHWPLINRIFYVGAKLGVVERGVVDGGVRSEVGVLDVGPLELLLVPGEIYPELFLGGVENPEGADFQGQAAPGPPLQTLMQGRVHAVVGLANDLVGYIIPKSQWDDEKPYLYGSEHAWYGEINSTGPEAAGAIYGGLRALLTEEP